VTDAEKLGELTVKVKSWTPICKGFVICASRIEIRSKFVDSDMNALLGDRVAIIGQTIAEWVLSMSV
jgi:hypothetical protein